MLLGQPGGRWYALRRSADVHKYHEGGPDYKLASLGQDVPPGTGWPLPGRCRLWQMVGMVPLYVPVELQRPPARGKPESAVRYFRLAVGLDDSDRGVLRLRSPVPDELRGGPLRVRFHLPPPTESTAKLLGSDWDGEIAVTAESANVVVGRGTERERTEALLLVFRQVSEPMQERLRLYATLRQEEG